MAREKSLEDRISSYPSGSVHRRSKQFIRLDRLVTFNRGRETQDKFTVACKSWSIPIHPPPFDQKRSSHEAMQNRIKHLQLPGNFGYDKFHLKEETNILFTSLNFVPHSHVCRNLRNPLNCGTNNGNFEREIICYFILHPPSQTIVFCSIEDLLQFS